MKKTLIRFFCIVFMLTLSINCIAYSQDLELPINPWDYQKMLGKGIDVDWAKTTSGMEFYSEKAVSDFKNRGITHVRIRVKDNADEKLLNHLQRVANDCLKYDIIPVIAYQANDFKVTPTYENMQKVADWWTLVSNRFSSYSYKLSFDIMIECSDELNNKPDMLNEMYENVVSKIRQTNPYRIIFISPVVRSDPENLKLLKIPSEHNGYLMAEWHFYASGPSKTNPRKLWTTGTESEKKLITDKINCAIEWQNENNIPTWVGAWLPSNYNDGNDYTIQEQEVFSEFMRTSLDNANIPFAVNADTVFYDREKDLWIDEMQSVFYSIFVDFTHIFIDDGGINIRNLKEPCILVISQQSNEKNLSCKIFQIKDKGNYNISFDVIDLSGNIIKAMLWESLNNMKPLCKSNLYTLN